MKMFYIHPFTLPVFFLCILWKKLRIYPVLYFFVFMHELSHALICVLLKEKCNKLYLFPWGCMLSLDSIPEKKKSVLILFAGPFFNLVMFFLGIFPKENLTLALFNLMPVPPLDGGVILNTICPKCAFVLSLFFILAMFILCIYLKLFPVLPIVLALIFIISEKNKTDRTIYSKIIGHFKEK